MTVAVAGAAAAYCAQWRLLLERLLSEIFHLFSTTIMFMFYPTIDSLDDTANNFLPNFASFHYVQNPTAFSVQFLQ